MKNIRIWFKKVDTAKYISHLDLSRCMARAIHKAKLPFWYTEGFNPHVFLTITMPISLGYSGLRESMDVKLLDENMPYSEIIEKLNAGLPLDIRAYEITEMVMKPGEVMFSSYDIRIDSADPQVLEKEFKDLIASETILVDKKTKKGMKEIDIKPDFANAVISSDDRGVLLKVTLPSSVYGSINPRLLFEAYTKAYGKELFAEVTRTNCYNEKMQVFC